MHNSQSFVEHGRKLSLGGALHHGTVDLAILNDQPYGMTLEQMGVSCAWDISCQRQNISKNFIREIFRNKKWRDALPNQGITIQGAWFPHGIDLRYTKLDRALRIERSLVVGTADLVWVDVGQLDLVSGINLHILV